MIIFPAIDLINGECVRLTKGSFDTVQVFSNDPVRMAQRFETEGASWLHVIDLNGAETGTTKNTEVIKNILDNTNLQLQVGGGIRSKKKIKELLQLGVTRVILGSYAVNQLDDLSDLLKEFQNQIIVSVDSVNGFVTTSGWAETSKYETLEFCKILESKGVDTIVYTDIDKDGMMEGPNFNDLFMLSRETSLNIIASGGVSSFSDVKQLQVSNLYGAIIGKAIYLNKLTVKEAILCSQEG